MSDNKGNLYYSLFTTSDNQPIKLSLYFVYATFIMDKAYKGCYDIQHDDA